MSRSVAARTLAALVAVAILPMATAQAQTAWYVDDDAPNDPCHGDPNCSDPNEDGSLAHPFDAIQEGIDASSNGDTVLVLDGAYTGGGNKNLDLLGKPITVRSQNGPANCIIDCEGSGRGFSFHSAESSETVVEGLTIQNGRVHQGVPGQIGDGGAVYCGNCSNPTLARCIVMANRADNGAGIACSDSSPTIIGCLLVANRARDTGGGVCCRTSQAVITNCTVVGNAANSEGGGGMQVAVGSDVTVTNTIFSGNDAPDGPEIRLRGALNPSRLAIAHSTVDGGSAAMSIHSACTLIWGEGNLEIDPLLVNPSGGDYHLAIGSPCIDAGTNDPPGGLLGLDLDGNPRPVDGDNDVEPWSGQAATADMGAYEFPRPTTPLICLSASTFQFVAPEGGPNPEVQLMAIRNCGINTLNWEVLNLDPWLDANPPHGQSAGETDDVTLSVDVTGLPAGRYVCVLEVCDPDASNSPQPVEVSLAVTGLILHVPSEYATIQAGIDAAFPGDVVMVADGTYTGVGNRDLDLRGKAITVRSENGPQNCVIDCEATIQDGHRAFYFRSGEPAAARVAGFTLRNGCSDFGGAIRCANSSPTIEDCVFVDNQAYVIAQFMRGGGFYCNRGAPTVRDCLFLNNRADDGDGGAIAAEFADPIIERCVVIENSARIAGALYLADTTATVVNCVIASNETAAFGGNVLAGGGAARFLNCTIAANGGYEGVGVFLIEEAAELRNCVLWGNDPQEGVQLDSLQFETDDPTVAFCDIEGGLPDGFTDGGGNIDAEPSFVDPNSGDYRLSPGSPCIDAGDNAAVPPEVTTDLDDNPRFTDDPGMPDVGNGAPPIVDMGAYEFQAETCFGDLDRDGVVGLGDLATLLANYGTPEGAVYLDGDLDRDSDVDMDDVWALLAVYGTTCP